MWCGGIPQIHLHVILLASHVDGMVHHIPTYLGNGDLHLDHLDHLDGLVDRADHPDIQTTKII